MKLSARNALGLVVGGVLLGAVVSARAQEGAPPKAPERAAPEREAPGRAKPPGRPGHFGPKQAIRSESVFPGPDGGPVRTVRTDRGELKSVDGRTLTIAEQDGTTVKVPVDDGTRINRDGQQAQLGDLKAGDQVFTARVKEGDGEFRTRGVRALSKERYAEMQRRHEECRQNPEPCRAEKMRKRPGGSGGEPPFHRRRTFQNDSGGPPEQTGPDASLTGEGPDVLF